MLTTMNGTVGEATEPSPICLPSLCDGGAWWRAKSEGKIPDCAPECTFESRSDVTADAIPLSYVSVSVVFSQSVSHEITCQSKSKPMTLEIFLVLT